MSFCHALRQKPTSSNCGSQEAHRIHKDSTSRFNLHSGPDNRKREPHRSLTLGRSNHRTQDYFPRFTVLPLSLQCTRSYVTRIIPKLAVFSSTRCFKSASWTNVSRTQSHQPIFQSIIVVWTPVQFLAWWVGSVKDSVIAGPVLAGNVALLPTMGNRVDPLTTLPCSHPIPRSQSHCADTEFGDWDEVNARARTTATPLPNPAQSHNTIMIFCAPSMLPSGASSSEIPSSMRKAVIENFQAPSVRGLSLGHGLHRNGRSIHRLTQNPLNTTYTAGNHTWPPAVITVFVSLW